MKLMIDRTCAGFCPHYFDNGWLVASRRNDLYRTADLGRTWEHLGALHKNWRRWLTLSRLADRFTHASIFHAAPFGDGSILAVVGKQQFILAKGARDFRLLHDSPLDHRPFRRDVLPGRCGGILIGAYPDNFGEDPGDNVRAPVPVHRVRTPRAEVWDTVTTFPEGTFRHVHALVHDTVIPGRSWLCTGDTDSESGIFWSDDDFATIEPFSRDGQKSRTCDLLFTAEHVIWGVDSPLEQSGIVRKARSGGPIEWLCETPCPVYYATTNEQDAHFFSTCVEPGPSVTSNRTEIYASTDGVDYQPVFSMRADWFPQYSVIHFPRGAGPENSVVFYSRATLRSENTMFVGRLRG
ncbi:MAG: hypothetical protein P8R54_15205 [Myxococcota bacterium]|nr:hypothetical protein [Myxococcota bacterium]